MKDGAESLRIRVSMAQRVRDEAKELNMSFIETVYHIFNVYFAIKSSQNGSAVVPSQVKIKQTTAPQVVQPELDSAESADEDSYIFDL